jgi:hypothetical protein
MARSYRHGYNKQIPFIIRRSSKPFTLLCSFGAFLYAAWWWMLLLPASRRQILLSLGLLGCVPKSKVAGAVFLGSKSNNQSTCSESLMVAAAAASPSSCCLDVMPHPIGLGTYLMHREHVATALRSAVRAGYRRIDCAPVYFNEDAVGDALFDILQEGVVSRSDLFVASKLPSPFHRNVEAAVRKTLNDLRLDYLDLYLSTCISWKVPILS